MTQRPTLVSFLCASAVLLAIRVQEANAAYSLHHEFAGETFFDGWDYYGKLDDTTWGNVTYVDQPTGVAEQLTYINGAGNAILKVDNTSIVTVDEFGHLFRPSVRLTTHEAYDVGTIVIMDAVHLPYGCSVWPAFWTLGIDKEWPHGGEIDILEGINDASSNQMALHSDPGCFQADNASQSGQTTHTNCAIAFSGQGCTVTETKAGSYGPAFAAAGGGAFAIQFDAEGIFIWFWSRSDIPANIASKTASSVIDTTTWGLPSAAYPASACDISQYFTAQKVILDVTLCGVWAGFQSSPACPSKTGSCAMDYVAGAGDPSLANAYFEIRSVRVYSAEPETGSTSTRPRGTPTQAPPDGDAASTVIEVITSTASLPGPSITAPVPTVLSQSGAIEKAKLARTLLIATAAAAVAMNMFF